MYLNIDDAKAIEQPTLDVVANAIENLELGQFIILGGDRDEYYVQAMFGDQDSWVLEYRQGSAEQHFAADPATTSIKDVQTVFERFHQGNDLKSLLKWQPVDLGPNQLEEGEVEYNGVIMNEGWPEQIEAAQLITQFNFDNAYLDRVAFGTETNNDTQRLPNCGDCGVLHGQFHVPGCEVEQCPKCLQQLSICPCEYDY